jgi:hypothetical protein
MYRALGAIALVSIAIAAPVKDAAAQDPVGGAILGGVTGGSLAGYWAAGAGPPSVPLWAGSLALPLLRRAKPGRAATVTISRLAINSVATGRGSPLPRSIARPRLRRRSQLPLG